MFYKIARQPIFEANQKEGFGRGSNENFFLLICLKDGLASMHRCPKELK
jgi:hypothetical protein